MNNSTLSDALNINGDVLASPSDENFNVKFDDTVPPTHTSTRDTATVTSSIASNLVAKIDVKGLTTTGDEITATYTVKNASAELGAAIDVGNIINTNPTYFEVTAKTANGATSIAAGESTTVTVKVKLIKTPVEQQKAGVTVVLTADATTS